MDYQKLIGRDFDDLDQAERVTITIAEHIVKLVVAGAAPDSPGTRDPDAVIDGVLMGLALVMEQAPECATPRALRKQAENMGQRMHHHGKIARGMFEENEVHPITYILEGFGAAPTVN